MSTGTGPEARLGREPRLILATQRYNDRPLSVFAASQWIYLFKHDAKSGHQPGFFKQTIFWSITARLGRIKNWHGHKGMLTKLQSTQT